MREEKCMLSLCTIKENNIDGITLHSIIIIIYLFIFFLFYLFFFLDIFCWI